MSECVLSRPCARPQRQVPWSPSCLGSGRCRTAFQGGGVHLGHIKGCSLRETLRCRPGGERQTGAAAEAWEREGPGVPPQSPLEGLPATHRGLPQPVAVRALGLPPGRLRAPVLAARLLGQTYLTRRTRARSCWMACTHSSLLMKSKVCSGCRDRHRSEAFLILTRGDVFFSNRFY